MQEAKMQSPESPEEAREHTQAINSEALNSSNSSASLAEPENMESTPTEINNSTSRDFVIVSMDNDGKNSEPSSTESPAEPGDIHSLHPMTRLLTIDDLESCCVLEEAAFEKPEERCSREKFIYRLRTCGELCLGIFTTAVPGSLNAATLATGNLVETTRENGAIGVLVAHIVSTRSVENVVTDEAMDYPRDWDSGHRTPSTKGHRTPSTKGHREEGRTICLHSLAVLPNFQGRGLGRTLLSAYISMMNGAGIADRIALIAHEEMVPFYERHKFVSKGPSKAEFGGGNWIDMVYQLQPAKSVARYG